MLVSGYDVISCVCGWRNRVDFIELSIVIVLTVSSVIGVLLESRVFWRLISLSDSNRMSDFSRRFSVCLREGQIV